MAATEEMAAFERSVRPIASIVFPDKAGAVLAFRPDSELQARIEELASLSTEGSLTEAECAEYEGYVRANKFVAVLKRLARQSSRAT
jgi:hypothetical protein